MVRLVRLRDRINNSRLTTLFLGFASGAFLTSVCLTAYFKRAFEIYDKNVSAPFNVTLNGKSLQELEELVDREAEKRAEGRIVAYEEGEMKTKADIQRLIEIDNELLDMNKKSALEYEQLLNQYNNLRQDVIKFFVEYFKQNGAQQQVMKNPHTLVSMAYK